MNKTVTVNIGGIVFHIDENAYEKFKSYLESIRSHFTTADGRDEIMQDIEARIAEMFQERIRDSKQVITLNDVDEVTQVMGKPEDFGDSEEKKVEEEPVSAGPVKRRLFRNPDDKMLGGVCSGVAAYFDIDTVWVRLVLAISFFIFGSGFLLYIILWIVIPEAKNAAEKLQMKGEAVTVSNIHKNVKEEMEALKSRVDEISRGGSKKAGTVIGRIFEAIGEVFVFIFKIIGKIIAVFFLFIGLVVAFAMFACLFALLGVPGTHIPNMWHSLFSSNGQFVWSFIGVILLVGIPFLMLAFAGLRMLFNIKRGTRIIGSAALGLWLVGLVLCLYHGVIVSREFREKEKIRKEISLSSVNSKTIYLEMNEAKNSEKNYDQDYGSDFDWNFGGERRVIINGKEYSSGRVKLDVVKSVKDSFQLSEILYSNGPNHKEAAEFASHINYTFTQTDSIMKFNRFFTVDRDEHFRNQHVQLIIGIPVGARVHLDRSLKGFIYDIDNINDVVDRDMLDRTWEMTDKGLKCMNCDGTERVVGGGRVHVHGDDGEDVTIDDNGIEVKDKDNETVKIDDSGIHVHSDNKKKK